MTGEAMTTGMRVQNESIPTISQNPELWANDRELGSIHSRVISSIPVSLVPSAQGQCKDLVLNGVSLIPEYIPWSPETFIRGPSTEQRYLVN